MEETYHIYKDMVLENGQPLKVVLISNQSEVLEFSSKEEADSVAEMFMTNSEKGYIYTTVKVG